MTATQAALTSVLVPALSAGNRRVMKDGQQSGGMDWQRALDSVLQGTAPSASITAEASYLLALGNLGVAPLVEAPPHGGALQPLAPHSPATFDRAADMRSARIAMGTEVAVRDRSGSVAARQSSVAATSIAAAETGAAGKMLTTTSSRPSIAADARAAAVLLDKPLPASQRTSEREICVTTDLPLDSMLPGHSPAIPPAQVLTAYALAMSDAPPSARREADFSVTPRSRSMPVRVHVQWRDRVADVWIGLDRRAFDQLPDIRAGVEDWVISRGGVLGRVVCNGEKLAGLAPTINFQGAF